MQYKNIIWEIKDGIGTITLNRPEKLNAINDAMLDELDEVLGKVEPDIDVRVIVIKGAGKAFSVGQDLSGVGTSEAMPPDPRTAISTKEMIELQRRRDRRWEYIFNYTKPTIAQVHGYCLAAGCYLALVCDLVIAAEDAVFGDPSLRMGLSSAFPLWPWLIGVKKTRELIYTGKYIDGKQAEEIGLINIAVPLSKLESEVQRYARAISISPADGMAYCKDAVNSALESRGVGTAWRFLGDMQVLGQQRAIGPGEFNFYEVRDKKGMKVALEERDSAFKRLGF